MKPMVMNTESGKKWTAIFYAEIEDMYTNESADTPVITLSSESVPAPPVDTGSTAIEEETMEVVEEKIEEESAPVLTSESVPAPPVDNGSTAVEERLSVSDKSSLTSNNIVMDLDESDLNDGMDFNHLFDVDRFF